MKAIVESVASTFYDDRERFLEGSIGLDGAVFMRGIPHEWHELDDVPELAGATSSPVSSNHVSLPGGTSTQR